MTDKKTQTGPKKRPIRRIRLDDTDNTVGADAGEVGYGKPPKAYQFKPGQSGNPSGRPKNKKNEATLTRELLDKKISVTERGKTKRISILEALLRRILEDALKGNTKSANFLFRLYHAPSASQPLDHLSDDDRAVLDAFTAQLRTELVNEQFNDK